MRRATGALLLALALTPAAGAATYADVLAALDRALADAQAQSRRYADSWGAHERVAALHLERAQLTGDYAAFERAEAALAEVRTLGAPPTAACATRARLAFAVHRLEASAQAIAQCRQAGMADGELDGLAAEIALYQGRYDEALAAVRRQLDARETIPDLARLSRLHFAFGHRSEALALLDRAERLYFGDSAQLRAWLKLQRAVIYLESGAWEESLAHLLAAERELAGWWLVDEHIAEVKALLGRVEEARALYRAVVARTGAPEYLGALAALDVPPAPALVARADAAFRARLARWPEAATGHALEHFLLFGTDPVEAVRLAEANARTRPYAPAQIALAQAYLRAGRPGEARATIEKALASPWDTGELHAVATRVYEATGDTAKAKAQRELALRRNPRAFAPAPAGNG